MSRAFIIAITLLLVAGTTPALEITSVAPGRGAPGTLVVLTGGPFSAETAPFLGQQYVPPLRMLPNMLEFTVPSLPPGRYSLTVQDPRETAVQDYDFEVLAPQPRIDAISPTILDYCSDEPLRTVVVSGANFLPGSTLLLNERSVPSRVVDTATMEFQLPTMPAGIYGVTALNADGVSSLPQAFWIDDVPEIASIERGDNLVDHYEMIIRGKNFFYNSILLIREPESSVIGQTTRQLSFHARPGGGGGVFGQGAPQTDRLLFRDCRTLVYHRYPPTPQDKDLVLQVINPDGKKTDPYEVFMP